MKRFTLILIGFVLALFIIAGCGGDGVENLDGGGSNTTNNNVFIFTSPTILGRNLKIWVYTDNAGAKGSTPLEGALATVVGTDKQAITNINGYAEIENVETGQCYITITKEDYGGYSQAFIFPDVSNIGSRQEPVTMTISNAPAISNIMPLKANVNEEMTITGVNFGTEQGKVEFRDAMNTPDDLNDDKVKNLEILSWSNNEIKCKMSSGVAEGNLYVYNKDEVKTRDVLNVKAGPSIDVIIDTTQNTQNSGSPGDTAVIYGSGFGTSKTAAVVTFNGTSATVTSCNPYNIVCVIPTGATTGNVIATISGVATTGVSFTVNGGVTIGVQ